MKKIFNIPNSSQDCITCATLWFDEFLKKISSENAKKKKNRENSQSFWKWTNDNPMKFFSRAATAFKS